MPQRTIAFPPLTATTIGVRLLPLNVGRRRKRTGPSRPPCARVECVNDGHAAWHVARHDQDPIDDHRREPGAVEPFVREIRSGPREIATPVGAQQTRRAEVSAHDVSIRDRCRRCRRISSVDRSLWSLQPTEHPLHVAPPAIETHNGADHAAVRVHVVDADEEHGAQGQGGQTQRCRRSASGLHGTIIRSSPPASERVQQQQARSRGPEHDAARLRRELRRAELIGEIRRPGCQKLNRHHEHEHNGDGARQHDGGIGTKPLRPRGARTTADDDR